jgi:hypothetical protein
LVASLPAAAFFFIVAEPDHIEFLWPAETTCSTVASPSVERHKMLPVQGVITNPRAECSTFQRTLIIAKLTIAAYARDL